MPPKSFATSPSPPQPQLFPVLSHSLLLISTEQGPCARGPTSLREPPAQLVLHPQLIHSSRFSYRLYNRLYVFHTGTGSLPAPILPYSHLHRQTPPLIPLSSQRTDPCGMSLTALMALVPTLPCPLHHPQDHRPPSRCSTLLASLALAHH